MKVFDFNESLWIEIPVEQNPAFNWVKLHHGPVRPSAERKEEALVICRVPSDRLMWQVVYVPVVGDLFYPGLFQCLECCNLFVNNYKPHTHEE